MTYDEPPPEREPGPRRVLMFTVCSARRLPRARTHTPQACMASTYPRNTLCGGGGTPVSI